MEKELRQLQIDYKTDNESRTIEGVSIVFNVLSNDLGGFREMIAPEAVEGVIENSDIFFLYNHTKDRGFLARSKNGVGSLKTEVKEDGVHFSFDANLSLTSSGTSTLEWNLIYDLVTPHRCSFEKSYK